MTLEDFFTLTEIKDGLTVTSRVEELMSVMQSNKDSILKNAGDASKQWAAVASTIAATKNRECLDVFVNLDGLLYLSSWLAEAQMLASNSIDRSLEESILALLEALENLGVDSSKLVSSGVWVAVENFVDHGSSRVQDQARKLFGSWKVNQVYDHESYSKIREDEMRVVAVESRESCGQKSVVTLCSRQSNNENHGLEMADEALLSGNSEENKDKGLELQNDKVGFESAVNSHYSNTMTETINNSCTDDIMKDVQENLSVKEKSSTNFGNMPISSDGLLYSGPSNAPMGTKEINRNLGGAVAVTSSSAGHAVSFDSNNIASMELEKNSLLQSSLDSNEVSRNASETCGSHDVCISKHGPSLAHVIDNQDSDNSSAGHGKVESDNEGKKDGKGLCKRKKRAKQRRNCSSSSRQMTISQCLGAMGRTTTDIELGIVDALDIATKVAQEVAREVDSGEGSSEEESDESQQFSGSQDFDDEDDLHTESPSNHSFEKLDVGVMDEKNNKLENGMMKSDDSQLAAAAKSEVGREKSPCDFDLNQDICLDETDVIVSSIPTSTPIMPAAAPFQLERSFSGKGSAAPSVDLREKQVICCGIDLNVAELEDDQVEDVKQYPLSESGRFNLDLNCKNEDDDMPPPTSKLKMETRLFLSHNGQESGEEVKLDLNDRPQFVMDGQHPWSKPVISILGTKVDVDRKDSVGGRRGNSLSAPVYGWSGPPALSMSSPNGYNGWSGPPALSMSSPMYVPGYMVDSRGTPVMMPQIAPFPQQDLFMSLAGGSVQPSFDQRSGFGVEVGNRESLKLRQFLTPEHSSRGMGEHSGANVENPSSSSSISIGGKRKEPETPWEWEFPPWR